MRDWSFWIIIHKWLRPRSGCQLFRIIWRRWSRTYQRSHPPIPEGRSQLLKRPMWVVHLRVLFLYGGYFLLRIVVQLRELAKHCWYAPFSYSWQPLRGVSHLWIICKSLLSKITTLLLSHLILSYNTLIQNNGLAFKWKLLIKKFFSVKWELWFFCRRRWGPWYPPQNHQEK